MEVGVIMGKYSLVAIGCGSNRGRVREIKLDGVDLTNLFTIDNFTSGMTFQQLWHLVFQKYDFRGFNKIVIRYEVKKGNFIYYDVIFDNKIINSCSKDVDLKYFEEGEYRFSYAIRLNNVVFRRVFDELMNFVDIYDVDKYKGMYFYNNEELFKLIKIYNSTFNKMKIYRSIFNDMIQEKVCDLEKVCDKLECLIENELSRYVTFREYIFSLGKTMGKREYDDRDFNYTLDELAYIYNRENDEFIDSSEVEQMGLVDNFDYKRKKVRL